jgi:hypothetical protein
MRAVHRSTLLILLATVAACAGNKSGEPRIQPRETYLEVENQAWMDMNIYALEGASRVRLGVAGSSRVTTLRIPNAMVGFGRMLRFQADPIGSTRVSNSFEVNVTPGQTIHLTIPATAGR